MSEFYGILSRAKQLQAEFNENVRDVVGRSIDAEIMEPFADEMSRLIQMDEEAQQSLMRTQQMLAEARSIVWIN